VAQAIAVASGVVIPAAAILVRATRSSGPGGQNVNKVASKVELRIALDLVEGLDANARARLETLAAGRRDSEGRLLLTSQKTRDQHRNLEDAREKARALVARALVAPRTRRPSRATAGARERRLRDKRRAARIKQGRRAAASDPD
jgi:ribosome-associated protein